MARAHVRHNVSRSGVGAIQNALVRLYLKGTTTPVSDAYNQETGGTLVTTLLSNSQGEVECWVDTPKYIDLLITDNGDTAYLSGDGTALQSWSEFTETISADPPPAEILKVNFEQLDVRYPPFNAKGDGVTDDTAAIQAAIDYAEATIVDRGGVVGDGNFGGGYTIFNPSGNYVLTSTLTMEKSNMWLRGAGASTRYLWTGGAAKMIYLHGPGTPETEWLRRTSISGITLDGQGVASQGIYVEFAIENTFTDLNIYRCSGGTGEGIRLNELAFVTTISGCTIRRNNIGVLLGNECNAVSITNRSRIQHNNGVGVRVADGVTAQGLYIGSGTDVEGNGGHGVYLGSGSIVRSLSLIGTYLESNDQNTATVANRREVMIPNTVTTCEGVSILGTVFGVNAAVNYPIEIQRGNNIHIAGCGSVGYQLGLALLGANVKRSHVQQSINDSSECIAEFVSNGGSPPNDKSGHIRLKNSAANYTIGAGRRGQAATGFGIYNETLGTSMLDIDAVTANDQTVMIVLGNIGGATIYKRVLIGAADSGGPGIRALGVAN